MGGNKNSYLPIVKRKDTVYNNENVKWQIFEEEDMLNSIFYMIKELYLA